MLQASLEQLKILPITRLEFYSNKNNNFFVLTEFLKKNLNIIKNELRKKFTY